MGITYNSIGRVIGGLREDMAGGVDKAKVLEDDRDIDGYIRGGERFLEPLFEIEQR